MYHMCSVLFDFQTLLFLNLKFMSNNKSQLFSEQVPITIHIGRSSATSGIYLLQPQNPLQLIRLENEEIKIGTGLLTKACLFLSLQSPRTRCVHTPQGGKWGMKFAIYFLCTPALGFLMGNVNEFLLCQNVMLLFLWVQKMQSFFFARFINISWVSSIGQDGCNH